MMRRRIAAAATVLALALLPAAGRACSCLPADGWSVEAGLAGGLVFAEVVLLSEPPESGARRRLYTVRVRRAVGMDAGGTARIGTARDGAACGIEIEGDGPVWLALRPATGAEEDYAADLCAQQPIGQVPPGTWDRMAGPAP